MEIIGMIVIVGVILYARWEVKRHLCKALELHKMNENVFKVLRIVLMIITALIIWYATDYNLWIILV